MKGIQVCSNEGPHPVLQNRENILTKLKKSSSPEPLGQNHWANFNQHKAIHSLVMKTKVCSNEGSHPFPRGDDYEIAKIH